MVAAAKFPVHHEYHNEHRINEGHPRRTWEVCMCSLKYREKIIRMEVTLTGFGTV